MNSFIKAIYLCIFISLVFQGNIFSDLNAKYSEEILLSRTGVRAMGMGSTYSTITGDIDKLYWNPAGIVDLPDLSVSYTVLYRPGYLKVFNINSVFKYYIYIAPSYLLSLFHLDMNMKVFEAQLLGRKFYGKVGLNLDTKSSGRHVDYVLNDPDNDTEYKKDIKKNIRDQMCFTKNDNVEENDWILMWKKNDKNDTVDKSVNPYWLYIHKLIPEGCTDKNYPLLGIELRNEIKPPEPFRIRNDKIFREVFFNVISRNNFNILRKEDKIRKMQIKYDDFIKELKRGYLKKSKKI